MENSETRDGIVLSAGNQQTGNPPPQSTRPRPGRRRYTRCPLPFGCFQVLALALGLLVTVCGPVHATTLGTRTARVQNPQSRFVEADILFDRRPAPQPAVYQRAEASSIAAPAETSTTAGVAASSSPSSGSSSTSIDSASTESTTPLPKPFDGGLGTNYTQPSCPTFLKSMSMNNTFTSCMPFSLLLQTSMSFFETTKSLSSITTTLNASCNIVFPTCSSLMSSYATTLRSTSACSQDYQLENPVVRQAYAGLLAYDVLYHASCLKNTPSAAQNNDDYCFANAVTNLSSPTDSYVYYLPIGMTLPAGEMPTCDDCLNSTMGLFATAAANKSQPLNLDYVGAAQQINQACGPNFVTGTVRDAGSGGGGQTSAAIPTYRVGREVLALMLGLGLAIPVLMVF